MAPEVTPEEGTRLCRQLARDNVVDVANGKSLYFDVPLPSVFEPLDSIRGEHQVKVERAVLQLNEILSSRDLGGLAVGQGKAQVAQSRNQRATIGRHLLDEQVGILRGVRKAQENRTRFSDEQIPDAMAVETIADFLGLPIFKCGHNPASLADAPRTNGDTLPSYQRRETARRPSPVYRSE